MFGMVSDYILLFYMDVITNPYPISDAGLANFC